jgi:hypothetical protein
MKTDPWSIHGSVAGGSVCAYARDMPPRPVGGVAGYQYQVAVRRADIMSVWSPNAQGLSSRVTGP